MYVSHLDHIVRVGIQAMCSCEHDAFTQDCEKNTNDIAAHRSGRVGEYLCNYFITHCNIEENLARVKERLEEILTHAQAVALLGLSFVENRDRGYCL